jgi:hypothetical protein
MQHCFSTHACWSPTKQLATGLQCKAKRLGKEEREAADSFQAYLSHVDQGGYTVAKVKIKASVYAQTDFVSCGLLVVRRMYHLVFPGCKVDNAFSARKWRAWYFECLCKGRLMDFTVGDTE